MGGLEQLAVMASSEHGIFSDPAFWAAIGFVIFAVAVFKPASKAITGGLDSRAEAIQSELDEARRLREEAQAMLAEYKRKQREAEEEAEAVVAQAKHEAEASIAEATAKLEESLKRREELATQKIAQAEAAALSEVREAAIEIAMAAAGKMIAESMDETKAAAMVDRAIGQLETKLN